MPKKVYLAGPISGLTYDECTRWRDEARVALLPHGIECYSPMRNKAFLREVGTIEQSYPGYALSGDRAIMTRDHHDTTTADAVLVNLLGTARVTIGTVMEIAWAWDRKIPVVAVIEPAGNLHDHPMVREAIGFRTRSVADAVEVVRSVLTPG
jgi:nucleoside 2-deoxyribosyltransferase